MRSKGITLYLEGNLCFFECDILNKFTLTYRSNYSYSKEYLIKEKNYNSIPTFFINICILHSLTATC